MYLLNRSSHSGLEDCTPHEMWFKQKPHVGHIRIWGYRACSAVLKEQRKKFDIKTRECILVGFYDTENLYQLWDIEAKELIKRRDVIFHEHIMGHPSLARNNDTTAARGEKVNILGQQVQHERTEKEAEELEDLYPVIKILKEEEWAGIPERVLSMQEELVQKPVPKSFEKAMTSGDEKQWLEAIKSEHDSLKRNGIYK